MGGIENLRWIQMQVDGKNVLESCNWLECGDFKSIAFKVTLHLDVAMLDIGRTISIHGNL